MVDAVVPVHLVAGFQADANCPGIEFNAATRIENAVGVSVPDSANLVGKGACSNWSVHPKIQQPAFQDHKHPNGSFRGLNLWSKKAMDQAQIGAESVSDPAAGNSVCRAALKVVGHFTFQRNRRLEVDADPPADSEHVEFCEFEPEVV